MYPQSGRVSERACEDKWELSIVKNLCTKNYKATANAAIKFIPFKTEILNVASCIMKKELRYFSKGPSMAKYEGEPASIGTFTNAELLHTAQEKIPVTHLLITSTSKSGVKYSKNKRALALSAMLNTWMPRSNFVYRINTLLTAGCCKTDVIDIFHRLGLASHPNTVRQQLESSAMHYDTEIMAWKKQIEIHRKSENLFQEALHSQTGINTKDGMDLSSVNFSRSAVEKYENILMRKLTNHA